MDDVIDPRASFLIGFAFLSSSAALALPEGPRTFCATYETSPHCGGQVPRCSMCHDVVPALNAYGLEVGEALWATPGYTQAEYVTHLESALLEVEGHDADGDGAANLEELTLGTMPADPLDVLVPLDEPQGENDFYDLGAWDPRFAYRRVSILYCGRPPSYDQMQAFEADEADGRRLVLDRLEECLDSSYWRDEGLHRIADKRIRPLEAVGFDGIIPLADYAWDYRLFSHILTDGRDARELLLADYHIDDEGEVVTGIVPIPPSSPLGTGGQPLPPDRRAGMITTQWFLMIHTMFSELPRTTAAQAYRAYMGQDISLSEGILPVEGEPRDVDEKGVQEPACAHCHSTIDPLSYAFASYNGIGQLGDLYYFEVTGAYDPTRTPWGADSVLLGEEVPDLVTWAERAANSDMFRRNLANMFWEHAFSREPGPRDQATFGALWRSVDDDGYSANKLIERIVLTEEFGAP